MSSYEMYAPASDNKSKRHRNELLRQQLEQERASFLSHWRDIGDFILPRRPRFFVTDVNKGDRRNQRIIDSTATLAMRTLQSGMMGGVTSPARPWFRLSTPDPYLQDVGSVKEWLYTATERMETVFARSNLYNVLPTVYGDMGGFGTAAMSVEDDTDNVVRFYCFPVGSYLISNNDKLKVDTFMRSFRYTVRQVVEKFVRGATGEMDWANTSTWVQEQWKRGNTEAWVDVSHIIQPNPQWDMAKKLSKYKRYSSCYYEQGFVGPSAGSATYDIDTILSEKGYDQFTILCPRWEITGEDAYGTNCPGMMMLGDVKQLQQGERRKGQAIDKMVNPPMIAPTSLKTSKATILPGDITYVDTREGQQGFRPAHEVRFSIAELMEDQQMCRNRIQRCAFEDLFLLMAESDRRQITAREVEERHQEKLIALGPVLEQLNQDLLDPLIDLTFQKMMEKGLFPEPPPEIQGMELKVEYISLMHQAQKLIGIEAIERFAGFVGNSAKVVPTVLDNVDTDEMVDIYADMTGVPPSLIRDSEEVAKIRQGREQQQQAQAQAMRAEQVAKTTKDLSQSDTGGQNALTELMNSAKAGQLAPVN